MYAFTIISAAQHSQPMSALRSYHFRPELCAPDHASVKQCCPLAHAFADAAGACTGRSHLLKAEGTLHLCCVLILVTVDDMGKNVTAHLLQPWQLSRGWWALAWRSLCSRTPFLRSSLHTPASSHMHICCHALT